MSYAEKCKMQECDLKQAYDPPPPMTCLVLHFTVGEEEWCWNIASPGAAGQVYYRNGLTADLGLRVSSNADPVSG